MDQERQYKRGPMSEETKAKISASRKGMVFTEEHKLNIALGHVGQKRTPEWIAHQREAKRSKMKPVMQLDMYGKEVARYDSLGEAARQTGLNKDALSACCNGRLKSCGGYRWQFIKEI